MAWFASHSWGIFGRYNNRGARREGRKDGQSSPPIPAWEAPEHPPYLGELEKLGNSSILEYARLFQEYAQRKDAAMSRMADEAENSYREKEKAATLMKAAVLRFKEDRNIDPPLKQPSHLMYLFFALIMLVVEVPLNEYIFRMLGDNEIGNMMMAVAVGFIILYCAHYLGSSLREAATGAHAKSAQIAALVTPLLIIVLSAAIRQSYLSSDLDTAKRISPVMAYGFFAAYNLGIFVAGVLLARSAHDPLLEQYHQRRSEHGRHLKRFTLLMEDLAHGIKERAEKRKAIALEAKQVIESVGRLNHIYQGENLRCRTDRGDFPGLGKPRSFMTPLNPPIPDELTTDWQPPKYNELNAKRTKEIAISRTGGSEVLAAVAPERVTDAMAARNTGSQPLGEEDDAQ